MILVGKGFGDLIDLKSVSAVFATLSLSPFEALFTTPRRKKEKTVYLEEEIFETLLRRARDMARRLEAKERDQGALSAVVVVVVAVGLLPERREIARLALARVHARPPRREPEDAAPDATAQPATDRALDARHAEPLRAVQRERALRRDHLRSRRYLRTEVFYSLFSIL